MAPSIEETVSQTKDHIQEKLASITSKNSADTPAKTESPEKPLHAQKKLQKEPLRLSGALDHIKSFDVTPVIGREFEGVDLAEWLKAPNSDELLRDLAITSTLTLYDDLGA